MKKWFSRRVDVRVYRDLSGMDVHIEVALFKHKVAHFVLECGVDFNGIKRVEA